MAIELYQPVTANIVEIKILCTIAITSNNINNIHNISTSKRKQEIFIEENISFLINWTKEDLKT